MTMQVAIPQNPSLSTLLSLGLESWPARNPDFTTLGNLVTAAVEDWHNILQSNIQGIMDRLPNHSQRSLEPEAATPIIKKNNLKSFLFMEIGPLYLWKSTS